MPPTYDGERLEQLRRTLKDFAPSATDAPAFRERSFAKHTPSPDEFPFPDLIRAMFGSVLNWTIEGPEEKMRWRVAALFKGSPLALEYAKFGLRLLLPSDVPNGKRVAATVFGKMAKGLLVTEAILQSVAETEIGLGNVTLANHFNMFDQGYRFLRDRADRAYRQRKPRPRPVNRSPEGSAAGGCHVLSVDIFKREREGGFLSAAMIQSYFSRLEHACALLFAFSGADPARGRLREVVEGAWDAKFKAVVDVTRDPRAKALYDALRKLADEHRNPMTHGGFDRSKNALWFHMPGVGALPARFSRCRSAFPYRFMPQTLTTHDQACRLFDDVDDYLATGPTELPMRYIASGLDVAFDSNSRSAYMDSMASETEFDAMMDHLSYQQDKHANMDY